MEKSKRKWIKRAALVFAAVFAVAVVLQVALDGLASYRGFYYRVIDNDTAVEIARYTGRGGSVRIPSHIGDLPVTRIAEHTFTYLTRGNRRGLDIAEVSIPHTITYIGIGAFGRNQLNSVTIGPNVTRVRRNAFRSNGLASVYISGSVMYLSGFYSNNLTSIHIPCGVRYIGGWAFRRNLLASVSIPDSVAYIGDRAFQYNRLTEVSIPRHTAVADNAFDRGVAIIRR